MDIQLVTLVILLSNVLISLYGFKNDYFIRKFFFDINAIKENNEYYRFITSGFLHADPQHLFFNMFSFYSFSNIIEKTYGPKFVIIIYAVSLLGGNILSYILNQNKSRYFALGASGAVSGIIFSSIFLLPGGSVYMFFIPIAIPAYIFGIIYILISVFGLHSNITNIGHDAHLGGAISGILILLAIAPIAITSNIQLFIILIALSILGIFLFPKIKKSKK